MNVHVHQIHRLKWMGWSSSLHKMVRKKVRPLNCFPLVPDRKQKDCDRVAFNKKLFYLLNYGKNSCNVSLKGEQENKGRM